MLAVGAAMAELCTVVVIVMLGTMFLMVPVMLLVWKRHWILVVTFLELSLMEDKWK